MDNMTATDVLPIVLLVCGGGGLLAGMIAYSRLGTAGSFLGFFIFGAILPLIGIVAALLVKLPPAAPQPPGWYPDPWGHAQFRWWDGYQWSYHLG